MICRRFAGIAPVVVIVSISTCPAQRGEPPPQPDGPRQDAALLRPPAAPATKVRVTFDLDDLRLVPGREVIGANVMDSAGERLGKIDNLLIDAHSGQAVYGIVAAGGVLGMGDKLIAVPWNAIRNSPEDRGGTTYVLDMSRDEFKNAPSFEAKEWALIGERGWMKRACDYFKVEPSSSESGSGGWGQQAAMSQNWQEGQSTSVKGTINKVARRVPARGMSEGTEVTVATDDGQEQTVCLGPSWFIQSQSLALTEGDQIEVNAREVKFRDHTALIARDVTLPKGRMALREETGAPVWDATSGASQEHTLAGDYIRVSDLDGDRVDGAGNKNVGEVKELAVNPSSGRIPYIVMKTGGVLGIGAHDVAVPWRSLQFSRDGDRLSINADETLLRSAPQLDSRGFAMINDLQFRRRVNTYFGPGRTFATPERQMDREQSASSGWWADSDYNKLYEGHHVTVAGTIQSLSQKPPMSGMSDAEIITVQTDTGQTVVQLGPSWFVSHQDVALTKGDQVTVKGIKVKMQGDSVVLASEISCPSGKLALRDDEGRPRWDSSHTVDTQ